MILVYGQKYKPTKQNFSTSVLILHNGERTLPSTNEAGKVGKLMQMNQRCKFKNYKKNISGKMWASPK